jgi:hypothetical protein
MSCPPSEHGTATGLFASSTTAATISACPIYCRAPFRRLPTRRVVTEDGPHPPAELATVAAGCERGHPRRPAGAYPGHAPGGSRGQSRLPADSSTWRFTSANAVTQDPAGRHAVYGMQGQ